MTVQFPALALILLFPLIGVVFNMFFGSRSGRGAVNVVGPGVMFAAFAVATWAFVTLLKLPPGGALAAPLWGWIEGGPFHVEFGLRVDALSGPVRLFLGMTYGSIRTNDRGNLGFCRPLMLAQAGTPSLKR